MYCTKCGNEIAVDAKFCVKCGAPVNTEPTSPEPVNHKRENIGVDTNSVDDSIKKHSSDEKIPADVLRVSINNSTAETPVATVFTSTDNEIPETTAAVNDGREKKFGGVKAKLAKQSKGKRILLVVLVAVIIALVSVFVIRAVNLSLYHASQDAFVSWDIIHEAIDALENKRALGDPELQSLVDSRKEELNTLADMANKAFLSNIGGYAINDEWQNDMAKLDKLGVSESDINALIDSGITSYAELIFELVANYDANPNGLERALKDWFDEDIGSKIYRWFRYDNYKGEVYPEIQQVLNDSFEEDYQKAYVAHLAKKDDPDREVAPTESAVESREVANEPDTVVEDNLPPYAGDIFVTNQAKSGIYIRSDHLVDGDANTLGDSNKIGWIKGGDTSVQLVATGNEYDEGGADYWWYEVEIPQWYRDTAKQTEHYAGRPLIGWVREDVVMKQR
jgi:hypothetical protein